MTEQMYTNPVIPGFHPDPSVCRVGDEFYLVTSSFEYVPGLPLFRSTDLVSWQQIGHVLTRPSQLDLLGAAASGGLFAPTIRHHDGRFYVTCTNVGGGGHFIVSADDPLGPWSDPVRVDQDGIDPSLFFEDGLCYFTSNVEPEPAGTHALLPGFERGAQQCLIDPDTGERLSETRFLWAGTGGRFPEAPHLYRRGDHYYLLLAEGGTEHGHMVTVARSGTPWGPWEGCPHNPVLTHRSLPLAVQAAGHADLVELSDGSWWAVALGTRPVGTFHHLGRETFLAPVTWTDDGWPVLGDDGRLPESAVRPRLPGSPADAAATTDTFTSGTLAPRWNTVRRALPAEQADLTTRPGALRLVGTAATTDDPLPVLVARRQQHLACSVAAVLDFTPGEQDEAGLTIRVDERHHADIRVRRGPGRRRVVELSQRIGPVQAVLAAGEVDDGPLELRIEATAEQYAVQVVHGGGLLDLGPVVTRYLSAEVARSFTGVYLGMYASGNGRAASAPAWWTRFDYTPA